MFLVPNLYIATLATRYFLAIFNIFSKNNLNLLLSILIALTCVDILSPANASNRLDTDHPLISRFEGANSFSHFSYDYIPADMLIAPLNNENQENSIVTVKGRGSFIEYDFPDTASHFGVVQSFKTQLKPPMFELIFECEKTSNTNTCGDNIRNLSFIYDIEFGLQDDCSTKDEFYIATAKTVRDDGQNTYLFVCVKDREVNQNIIEEKVFQANKIKIALDYAPNTASLSALKAQTIEDIPNAKDHPLINRFPNSKIVQYKTADFVEAILPVKGYTQQQISNLPSDYLVKPSGNVTFIEYLGQEGLSQYQVYENYLHGLKNGGMEVLFACLGQKECKSGMEYNSGIADIVPALNIGNNCTGSNIAVITAKMVVAPKQNSYLHLCISSASRVMVAQTIIEEKLLITGLVTLSTDEMAKAITEKGKIAIYGIHFASNRDEILEESTPTLVQLANLLIKQPTLKLFVVGHTDSQGEEIYNQSLSEKRAQAVITKLVQTYGIAQNRLQARGVGELVPVSTNQANEGRQLNRRVELVQM